MSDPVANRASRALQSYFAEPDRRLTDVRDAIYALVAQLRDGGAPPEAAVVTCKRLVEEATLPPLDASERRELSALVLHWCIDEYYRGVA